MSSSVAIVECSSPTELFKQHPTELAPQSVYVELDLRTGELFADHGDCGGMPEGVYYGFRRRYDIPILSAEAVNRLMHTLTPLANRILADWQEHWDGNNHVPALGADASDAETNIFELTALDGFPDSDIVVCWEIDGAINGDEIDEYGITAATSNARLDDVADDIIEQLANCGFNSSGIAVCPGLVDHLRKERDDLAREATSG